VEGAIPRVGVIGERRQSQVRRQASRRPRWEPADSCRAMWQEIRGWAEDAIAGIGDNRR